MLLSASEFHADSLAPAFTFRKVYPAYRLQKKKNLDTADVVRDGQ